MVLTISCGIPYRSTSEDLEHGLSVNGIKCLFEVDKYQCHFSVGITHLLDDTSQG